MTKIICNSIEYVFLEEVLSFVPGKLTLHRGAEFKKIEVVQRPEYSSEHKIDAPGSLLHETVVAVAKFDENSILRKLIQFPVIVRLKKDKSIFYVGNTDFPAICEISSNKIFDTFTFTAKS